MVSGANKARGARGNVGASGQSRTAGQRSSGTAPSSGTTTPRTPTTGYSGASGFQTGVKDYSSLTGAASGTTGVSGQTQTLEQRVAAYVKEKATYATGKGPTSTPVPAEKQQQITDALMSMPSYVLERMMKDKLEFHIFTKMPPGEEKTGAGYCWSKPPILIINDEVLKGTNTAVLGTAKNAVVHEMGHYYDDVLAKDTKADKAKGLYTSASSKDPAVEKMFKDYQERFRETLSSFLQQPSGSLTGIQGAMGAAAAAGNNAAVLKVLQNPMPERDQWEGLTAAQRKALGEVVFDGGYSATNSGEFIGMATEKFFGTDADRAYLKQVCPEVFAWLNKKFAPPAAAA